MSLTSHLQKRKRDPKTKFGFRVGQEMLYAYDYLPATLFPSPKGVRGYPYATVGMAATYLVKFTACGFDPEPFRESVIVERVGKKEFDVIEHLKNLSPDMSADHLVHLAIAMAYSDKAARESKNGLDIFEPDRLILPAMIQDLKNLWTSIGSMRNIFKSNPDKIVINPTFGKLSYVLGGADAPLVVDNMLYIIRTSNNSPVDYLTIAKGIAYACMSVIWNDDYQEELIDKICWVYTRQGQAIVKPFDLSTWDRCEMIHTGIFNRDPKTYHDYNYTDNYFDDPDGIAYGLELLRGGYLPPDFDDRDYHFSF